MQVDGQILEFGRRIWTWDMHLGVMSTKLASEGVLSHPSFQGLKDMLCWSKGIFSGIQ
ncbi:unnamed protein product [Gulo gulo]|uniref:Uncharacterized protein n=1 Tax=Gulo gulo TaxID=48420 RepID=A0A9X9M9D6_GULGU|nr:unnamed protein product [Gulo gulo]